MNVTDTIWDNEDLADHGSNLSKCVPGWDVLDTEVGVIAGLANVIHYLHRLGLDPQFVWGRAQGTALGDLENGPEARCE